MNANIDKPRNSLSENHSVLEGCRKLSDDDILQSGDQTAVMSCLMSLEGDRWRTVDIHSSWAGEIGKTIGEVCSPDSDDIDAWERVFRRPKSKRKFYG